MRRKGTKWAAALMAAVFCMSMAAVIAPLQAIAAQETEAVVVSTTQPCSIWSAPATLEENRVKYVDEGYQIMIYPEVIQSGLDDGKTFFRTANGAYVLCKCVTEEDGSNLAAAGGSGVPDVVSGLTLPAFDNTADVVNYSAPRPGANGTWVRYGYDASGNEIRREYYESDQVTLFMVDTLEYDPAGRWKKAMNYQPDGNIASYSLMYFYEYDEAGNTIRTTQYRSTGMPFDLSEYNASGHKVRYASYGDNGTIQYLHEYDAAGNEIKRTSYNADGTIESYIVSEYDAAGHTIKNTSYNANGMVTEQAVYEYNEAGQQVKGTFYNGAGVVQEYFVWECDAAGNRIAPLPTWYNSDGTKQQGY